MSVHLPQFSVFPASITIDREAATKALKGHVPRHFLGLLSIVRGSRRDVCWNSADRPPDRVRVSLQAASAMA
jgi:hypothetical protein